MGGRRVIIPCDFRVYGKPTGGKNKNEHFRDMLQSANERGFTPERVVFASWRSSLENLKSIRSYGCSRLTRLTSNRQINLDGSGNDGSGNVSVREVEIGMAGRFILLQELDLLGVTK